MNLLGEALTLPTALKDCLGELFLGFLICLVVQIALALVVAVLWHRFNKLPAQQFAREQEEEFERWDAAMRGKDSL